MKSVLKGTPNEMAKEYCLVVLLLCFTGKVYGDVLCENGFCSTYTSETGCATPAAECAINNATHSGLWLPSPTICNCCRFCLPFIVENGFCTVGGSGMGTTIGRCGNGLTCVTKEDGDHRCERMESACHSAQDEYDARQLSGLSWGLQERPNCDGKGKYAPYTCVPTQSCFCQSDEGERIFGEVLYTGSFTQSNMHCGCARLHDKISKYIRPGVPNPVIGPRCTSDGNFHPIQCIGRNCYCVNPQTGVILAGSNRAVDLDVKPLSKLVCYDPDLDLYPELTEGTAPFNYTTPCIENMETVIEMLDLSREEGYNVEYFSSVPGCLPDGSFGRTSMSRNGTKICVDERGQQIGDYEALPGTTEFDNMDCKCAYTAHVIMASEVEKPVCCSNGSFRRVQCRRGLCRCVDADGRQTERENADPAFLSCFTQTWRTC